MVFTTAAPIDVTPAPRDPCNPSPCGLYSQCRDVGGIPSCTCSPSYLGVPPNCHPECVINEECRSDLACINQKCEDPCPGSCGLYATCTVLNHLSICTCNDGYVGNPFSQCTPKPIPRMYSRINMFLPYIIELYFEKHLYSVCRYMISKSKL